MLNKKAPLMFELQTTAEEQDVIIKNFKQIVQQDLEIGKYKTFDGLELAGDLWGLNIYPSGFNDTHKDYVSVFLRYFGEKEASTQLQISLNHTGTTLITRQGKAIFNAKGVWGWPSFMSRTKLLKLLNDDDAVTFTVRIEKCSEHSLVRSLDESVLESYPTLVDDMTKFLNSAQSETSDVTFIIGNNEFSAHKTILMARSSVFNKMFTSGMKETTNKRIPIQEIDPNVFTLLLHFIYTDKILDVVSETNMCQLLLAADYYDIPRLRKMCELQLMKDIKYDNVCGRLLASNKVDAPELKQACLQFASRNPEKIALTEGFVQLDGDLMKELFLFGKGVSFENNKKRKRQE